jgi:hypothetical protein
MLSVMIRVLRVSISLFCGYPKSIISVKSQTNVRSMSNAEGTGLRRRTIDELVNQHKVILDGLLIQFPKVRLGNRYEPITELKNHGRVDIISA